MITLQEKYHKEVIPAMKEKFGYANVFSVPKVEKIVINTGVGKMINARKGKEVAEGDEDLIKDLISEFSLITAQHPQIVRARKSIAGFKLREGMIAGVKATLRGNRMHDFLARLIHIAFPRTRDFRGLEEKSVDESGNMTIGIIFPVKLSFYFLSTLFTRSIFFSRGKFVFYARGFRTLCTNKLCIARVKWRSYFNYFPFLSLAFGACMLLMNIHSFYHNLPFLGKGSYNLAFSPSIFS